MSYKTDMEKHIRRSYKLISEYEEILRLSADPKEISRAQHTIDEQWKLVKSYVDKYLSLCKRLNLDVPEDLAEIVASFPEEEIESDLKKNKEQLISRKISNPPDNSQLGQPMITNVVDNEGSKMTTMKNFFVSYNSADKHWAEWIAWQLEEAGYTTVIQAWDFRPGGNFVLDMQKAAEDAERTIAVLSPNYLKALYTQPEWAAAFAQDPTGEKKTLLPVRIQECKLKGMLSQIVYIDLVGLGEQEAQATLLAGLSLERAKPMTAPSFPGAAKPKQPDFPGLSSQD